MKSLLRILGVGRKEKANRLSSINPRYGNPATNSLQSIEELSKEESAENPRLIDSLTGSAENTRTQREENPTENPQVELSELEKKANALRTKLQIASLDETYRASLTQDLQDFTRQIEELSEDSAEIEQKELVEELSRLLVNMVFPGQERPIEEFKKDLEEEGLKEDLTNDEKKLIGLLIDKIITPEPEIFDVIELFYIGYKKKLENIGIKDLEVFNEIVGLAIDNDIENKHISFKGGKFYSKVSDGEGQVVDTPIDYIGDIIKSGEIKQLFNLHKAWKDVLENTKEGRQKLQEVGMAEKDFLGVMRRVIANDAVVGFRPISKYAKSLIEIYEAIGKLFQTKGKSSENGPGKGAVFFNSFFSKASKSLTEENTFAKNLEQVRKYQKKNNLDLNKSNREFYKITLTKIMNLNEDQQKQFYRILDSLDIEVDISDFNKELLLKINKYCKADKENNFQNVLDIINHDNKFRDNEEIRKDLLSNAFEAIKDEDSKKQNIKRQDFISALNELNISSKKVFEVKANIDGKPNYELYFAEEGGIPLYKNDDNQKPLFFIKVPKSENSDEFDLYQYNYNCIAEGGNEVEEYVIVSDEKQQNSYKKILKPVEAFVYCRYKYEEKSKEVVEEKRIVTADYDMLFAMSKKGFPLELNSPEEIINELKYHRLKEDMEYSRFVSLLLKAADNSDSLTSDDQEFLMARVIELNILSSGDDKKDWEKVQRILLVKFKGGQEQIKQIKSFIESRINSLQDTIDKNNQTNEGIKLILKSFGEAEWNYATYKKIIEILKLDNPAPENTLDKQKFLDLLSEIGFLEQNGQELSEQRFDNYNTFSESRNKELEEVILYLKSIKKSENLDAIITKLKNLPKSSSADLKTARIEVRKHHIIMRYKHLFEETQKENQEGNDKFLISKSEQSKRKYETIHDKELQSLDNLQKLKTLLTLERLIEKLEKEEITKLEIKDIRIIVNELLLDNVNDPDFKKLHDLIKDDEIDKNKLKEHSNSLKNNILNPDKTNWLDLKDKMKKLFNSEEISDSDQESIAEIIAELERYRKSEVIKSEIYEVSKGLITMDDWAFIEALTFDAHGNINHGMEYGNPYAEPFTPGNFVFLLPSGEVKIYTTEQEVCDLVNDLRQNGYPVPVNIRWGWVCDKEGKLSIPSKRFNFAKIDKFIDDGQNNDNPAAKASRFSLTFRQAKAGTIHKVNSIGSSVEKKNTINKTNSLDSVASQDVEKETNDLSDKLKKNFSSFYLRQISSVLRIVESKKDKNITKCVKAIEKAMADILKEIELTTKDLNKDIRESVFLQNKHLGEIYKNFEIIEGNLAGNTSKIKSVRAFKNDVLNEMFIDIPKTQEEKDKISEARLGIYTLYLHICYLENSPEVVYGEVEGHFKSSKDQTRIANVKKDFLDGIKDKTQGNLNGEKERDIAESKQLLLNKWNEYCELLGAELIFRETDFDKEFLPVMKKINNQVERKNSEPSSHPMKPEGSEKGRQALLKSIKDAYSKRNI